MAGPTTEFWQERFDNKQTPWDRGGSSPGLLSWLDFGVLTPCRIAVPGCGAGWEVAELARRGFDVVGIDYTQAAVDKTHEHCQHHGVSAEIVRADVLRYDPTAPFDAVYEQTCMCALHPDNWVAYAGQLRAWLKPGGVLAAMFMQLVRPAATEEGAIQGPPYHCDINAMRALFSEPTWAWPKPPFVKVLHPSLAHELSVKLVRH